MTEVPILLLYAPSLKSHDGTTVQLRRLLAGFDVPVWHIHGATPPSFKDFPENCFSLEVPLEPRYPFRRGAGFLRRLWRRQWVPRFVRSRVAEVRRKTGLPAPRVAYVVVYDELNAVFALAAMQAAGIDRYVLHLMDLFHARFEPDSQPALAKLIANASGLLVVCQRLVDEVASTVRCPVEIMPLVTDFARSPMESATRAEPYLLMTGAMYAADPRKLDYLYKIFLPAWLRLKAEMPSVQWLYAGADAKSFSPALKAAVKNCGLLEKSALGETLAGARCALLPIIHHAEDHYRFSVPSRLVDYLSAGLPIIAPPSPGTATGDFLESFAGRCVVLANTEDEAYAALKRLFLDDGFHHGQAAAARAAAPQFSIPHARQRLREMLQRIAR